MSTETASKFPNPFFDIASTYVPTEIVEVFEWCEYLYTTMGTYRAATRRLVRYFITDITLEGETEDERNKFKSYLNDTLGLTQELAQIGDEVMVYGNAFISIYFPFDRFLTCPECRTEYRDNSIKYKFTPKGTFSGVCPKCGREGEFHNHDRRSPDSKRVKIIKWNPKQIRIKAHPVSGKLQYYWSIPQDLIDNVMSGDPFYISETPIAILDCISRCKSNNTEYLFKFNDDSIFHIKDGTLSGLPIIGWGIPPILPNFKLAYYIQVLRRYDEAIAFDYIVPFRVLFPDVGPSNAQDPAITGNLQNFRNQLVRMVSERRKDPTQVQIAPYKVGYQLIGGEGRSLAPKESISFAIDELLSSLGYPAELYHGTLSVQAAPTALRLFEQSWGSLVAGFNNLTAWITSHIATHFAWGDIEGRLRSVTLADDMERKALALQASAGMDISKDTAYKPFGIDYNVEQEKVIQEQQKIQELQTKAMEEQEATQAGASGGATGGGPVPPGGEVGATPGDVNEQARQMAEELLLQPDSIRRSELIKIKHSNPTLHALVKQYLADTRSDLASQGKAQLIEQARANGGM